MSLSSPPHFGQCPRSKAQASAQTNLYTSYVGANTRLSSLAQLSRTGWWRAQFASHSAGFAWWAASRCMNSSGLITDADGLAQARAAFVVQHIVLGFVLALALQALVALAHLVVGNQGLYASIMQGPDVLVAVIARIGRVQGARLRVGAGLLDHGQQHALLRARARPGLGPSAAAQGQGARGAELHFAA